MLHVLKIRFPENQITLYMGCTVTCGVLPQTCPWHVIGLSRPTVGFLQNIPMEGITGGTILPDSLGFVFGMIRDSLISRALVVEIYDFIFSRSDLREVNREEA